MSIQFEDKCPLCGKGKLVDFYPKIVSGRTPSLILKKFWGCGSSRQNNILKNNCTDGKPIESKIPLQSPPIEGLSEKEHSIQAKLLEQFPINEKIKGDTTKIDILAEMTSPSYFEMKEILEKSQLLDVENSFTLDERLKIVKELSSISNKTPEMIRIIDSHLQHLRE